MAKTRQTTAATRHVKTTDTPLNKHETFAWDAEVPQLAQRRRGGARTWIIQTRAGGLLGHSSPRTTRRCAHLDGTTLAKAADTLAKEIEQLMNGKTSKGVMRKTCIA